MTTEKALAKILKHLRKERKISQEQFAVKANINRSYVSQMERGLGNPTLSVLFRIAEACDITFMELASLIEQEIQKRKQKY